MDKFLQKTQNIFTFIDNILNVTNGTIENISVRVIRVLDETEIMLKLEKCYVDKKTQSGLGIICRRKTKTS